MARKSDPVESLAKVLRAAKYPGRPIPSHKVWMEIRGDYRAMARAAIAHLSKPKRKKFYTGSPWCDACHSWHVRPKSKQHHEELKCFAPYKPKRGAKRGK